MAQVVAARYAEAFADVLMDPKSGIAADQALQQLADFNSAIEESQPLREILLSPAVARDRKRAVVERLGQTLGMSRVVRNLLFVIINKNRSGLLADIRQAIAEELDRRHGIVRAAVISAQQLDNVQRERVQQELSRATGKQVRADFQVDPEVLGGIVARIGTTIYDGSVRGQLQALRHQFVSRV